MKLWNLFFTTLVIISTVYPIYQSFDRQKMKGHWHFTMVYEDDGLICGLNSLLRKEQNLFSMTFDGEFGAYNAGLQSWSDFGFVFELFPYQNKLITPVYECIGSVGYEYHFEGENLILKKPGWENQYLRGQKYRAEDCDLQQDYFLASNLDIELPIVSSGVQYDNFDNKSGTFWRAFYLGKSKHSRHTGVYGDLLGLKIQDQSATLQDITSYIKRMEQFETDLHNFEYVLFADKEVWPEAIKEIIKECKKSGLGTLYIAHRLDTDIHKHFEIKLLPVSIANPELNKLPFETKEEYISSTINN